MVCIGTFKTAEEAEVAYTDALNKLGLPQFQRATELIRAQKSGRR